MYAYYLKLQARRIHRMVLELGLHPVMNYLIVITGFLGISFLLFFRDARFLWLYLLIALQVISVWSSHEHNDFLKLSYSRADYYRIRLCENVLSALPFILCLSFMGDVVYGLALLVVAVLMAFFSYKVSWNVVIPTPFARRPFEFIVGFRLTFALIAAAYFLTYISLRYANFNIGLFAILAVSIVCTLFYTKVEDVLYVWIFSSRSKAFLGAKIKTAFLYTLLLSLPIALALAVANPQKISLILLFQFIGLCYVTAGVLCKYSSFPDEIGIREGLLLMFSVMFPPLLLFSIPFYYLRSTRQLEGILK